ncbi:MAG: aspartate/glutamate racemase family protein [Candidatus Saccharimonadales bacterium]
MLVIPCNSFHVFIEEIRSVVRISVLSIVEEIIAISKMSSLVKVGLISTSATVAKNVYDANLRRVVSVLYLLMTYRELRLIK